MKITLWSDHYPADSDGPAYDVWNALAHTPTHRLPVQLGPAERWWAERASLSLELTRTVDDGKHTVQISGADSLNEIVNEVHRYLTLVGIEQP